VLWELPKIWGFPFNIYAMAEVAMDVPNKRYYIEKTANINVKSEFIEKCYRLTHRKQQNWN